MLGQISNNYALFSEPEVDEWIDDILRCRSRTRRRRWGELDENIARPTSR